MGITAGLSCYGYSGHFVTEAICADILSIILINFLVTQLCIHTKAHH